MIDFFSNWVKGLGLSIIVISILEMILPNNKTKKYVRMIFGLYIIFNIISPFIKNKEILDINRYDFNKYNNYISNSNNTKKSLINNKIEDIYIQELEKDISDKLNKLGYKVIACNVYATFSNKNTENYIEQIELIIENNNENKIDNNDKNNKLIENIQKVENVKIVLTEEKNNDNSLNIDKYSKITEQDFQKIKKFLKEEYGVEEKCLKIN